MSGFELSVSDWMRIRWWHLRAWSRRCEVCGERGHSDASPKWRDDRTAQMLGIAYFGCPECGHGAIEERGRGTCRSWCVQVNHPGREHDQWLTAPDDAEGKG